MANYQNLKNAIAAVIKANANNEITGNILQTELLSMVTVLGAGYQFMDVATPQTNPGTPDARVFYVAFTPGTYANFNGIVVTGFCVLKYSNTWTKTDIPIGGGGGGVSFETQPDDLQLETVGSQSVLKFADRIVNNNIQSGKNYTILRENETFAEQVIDANTIYEIRYNFALSANFTVPSGCELRFNGGLILGNSNTLTMTGTLISGDAKILNCQIVGTVRNTELQIDWFGAVGDGTTDDSVPFTMCLNLAILNNATMVLNGAKSYAIKESIDFTLNQRNIYISGNGASIVVPNPGYIQFKNARYLTVQCPQNLVRKTAAITFSSLPSGIEYGDIINIASSEVGENSYNTRRQQTTRVGKIEGNTIYLSDDFLMDFSADKTTLNFYKPARVELRNFKFKSNRGSFYAGMHVEFVIPFFDGIEVGGTSDSSYGINLYGCQDGVIRNGTAEFITYGYLINACAHIVVDNLYCPALATHACAIATFSNYICVKRLTGIGQLIESHTGFNITYEDCVFGATSQKAWNMRAVGFALRRCRVISIDGSKVQPILIGSVALYDTNIYDEYSAVFEDCVFPMDSIGVNHSGLIEFIGCEFLPNTRILFGAAAASVVRKGRIIRCDNVKYVSFFKPTFELETDRQRFDAVKNESDEYEISLALASFKLNDGNGEWRGYGRVNEFDLPDGYGAMTFPIKLHLQRSNAPNASCGQLYVSFEFTIVSANRANTLSYAEKTYLATIAYFPLYNAGSLVRVVDKTPDETLLTATISDFAYSGSTSNPEEQEITFNINMVTQITSYGAARNTLVYDCKVIGRAWQ